MIQIASWKQSCASDNFQKTGSLRSVQGASSAMPKTKRVCCCRERAAPSPTWVVICGSDEPPTSVELFPTERKAFERLHQHAMMFLDLSAPKTEMKEYKCHIVGDLAKDGYQSFMFDDEWVEIHRK